ncbi:21671_t:CDS:1, partial [Racocetra persica]
SHEAKQLTQTQSTQTNFNTEPDLNTTPLSRSNSLILSQDAQDELFGIS